MLEKLWPFGRSRVRKAVEEALEKAFQDVGEVLEPLSELSEHEDHYLLRVEVPGLGPENLEVRLRGTSWSLRGEAGGEARQAPRRDRLRPDLPGLPPPQGRQEGGD